MPTTLTTIVSKIRSVPKETNAALISEFRQYMRDCNTSERHQNHSLKMVTAYAKFLGDKTTFYDIKRPEHIVSFLDTKLKTQDEDPEKRQVTTWNSIFVTSSCSTNGYTTSKLTILIEARPQ